MDLRISEWILSIFGNSKIFAEIFYFITLWGGKTALLVIFGAMLIRKDTRRFALFTLFCMGATYVFNDVILKSIFNRARPFIQNPELVRFSELANFELPLDSSSFPSDILRFQ